MILNFTAGGTERADALGYLKGPGAATEFKRLADQRAGWAGPDAVAAEIAVKRVTGDGVNDRIVTAIDNFDRFPSHDFTTDLDTFFAEDAAIRVTLQQLPVITDRQALKSGSVAVFINFERVAGILQIALSGSVAYRTVQGVVDQH